MALGGYVRVASASWSPTQKRSKMVDAVKKKNVGIWGTRR
jgi:hypothetical protein